MAGGALIVAVLLLSFRICLTESKTMITTPVSMLTSLLKSTSVQHGITEMPDADLRGGNLTSSLMPSIIPHYVTWPTGLSSVSHRKFDDQESTTAESVDFKDATIDSTNASSYEDVLVESSYAESIEATPWRWNTISWSWWSALQLVSSILGVLGNLLVVVVVWQRRLMSRSTDTLIGSLALADFCTSIFILPVPTAVVVPSSILGELYCRLIYTSYFFWLSVGSSIYTLTLISLERLIAVKYPIEFNRFSSRRHTSLAVLAVWSVVFTIDLFLIVTSSVDGGVQSCVVRYRSTAAQYTVGILIFMVYFLVPTTVMLLAQAFTAYILHKKSKRFKRDNDRNTRSNPSYNLLVAKNRVLKILFMVVMIFIICWGPNNIAYLLYNVGVMSPSYLYSDTNHILNLLAFYNSCLNPIVYTARHQKFRAAIRGLFIGSKPEDEALFEYKIPTTASSHIKEDSEPKI